MGDSTARVGLSPFQRVSGLCSLRYATSVNEDSEDLEPVLAVSSLQKYNMTRYEIAILTNNSREIRPHRSSLCNSPSDAGIPDLEEL